MNTHQNLFYMSRKSESEQLENDLSARFAIDLALSAQKPLNRSKEGCSSAKLPDELCIMILEHVRLFADDIPLSDYRVTLSNLCLVNHMFREECQSRLFQTLHYSGNTRFAQRTRIRVWKDLIKADDPRATLIASWVSECTFSDWYREELSRAGWDHTVFRDAVLETAAQFCNLKAITLYACPLVPGVPAVLAQMKQVRTVVLDACFVVGPLATEHLGFPGKFWTSLTVRNVQNLGNLIPAIVHLVDIDDLHSLSTDSQSLIISLFSNRPAPKLKYLRIASPNSPGSHTHDTRSFSSILVNTPNLTCLHWHSSQEPSTEIAPTIVPKLEELTAETHTVGRLIHRRPITSLHLLGPIIPELPFFRDVDVAARIRKLVIPMSALNRIGLDIFPALEAITLLNPRCAKRQAQHIDCTVPSAKTIVYDMNHSCCTQCATLSVRMRTQLHQLVSGLLVTLFPNATRVTIGTAVEWRRDDVGGGAGVFAREWRPRIVDRKLVRRLLLRNDVRIAQDISGCLISVLQPGDLNCEVGDRLGYDFVGVS